MVPAIKKVLVLYSNRQTCEQIIAIKSLFKGTPKERSMFKDVSEKQCLLLYLPSSAQLTLVGLSPPHL